VQKPMEKLRGWLSRHGSQLATVGLAVVLVSLAGFSLWAALRTNTAAQQADRDSQEQQVWQTTRLELARVEAGRRSYMQQQRPQARADITRATVALRTSLRLIQQHADPDDAAFAQQVQISHQRYQQATGRLLAAVATRDAARARALEAREVQPAHAALADQLAEGAEDEQDQVAESLVALRQLGERLVVAAPVVFTPWGGAARRLLVAAA
jgi:hypothetical protein